MAKGKSLERLVHIIQETLKDHPSTIISQDVQLQSLAGDPRQFDVIIDTIISGQYKTRIAIECKDHGRKVGAGLVESFYAKCLAVGGIDKFIMVSSKGFQKSAKSSAKLFKIELETLEKCSGDKVIQWINTQNMYRLSFSTEIKKIDLILQGHTPPKSSIEISDIVYDANGHSFNYGSYIDGLINNDEVKRGIWATMISEFPDLQARKETGIDRQIEFNPYATYFKFDEKETFIEKIIVGLYISIHEERIEPDVRAMRSLGEEEIKAGVVTVSSSNDGSKLRMVINAKSGNFKSYALNPDESVQGELKTLYKYDPKTGTTEFPKDTE